MWVFCFFLKLVIFFLNGGCFLEVMHLAELFLGGSEMVFPKQEFLADVYAKSKSLICVLWEEQLWLHTVATTLDVQAVVELVVEVDSRISSKETINEHRDLRWGSTWRASQQPMPWSRDGFRAPHSPKFGQTKPIQLQCIVKVSDTKRQLLLEASGRVRMFIRDFPKGSGQLQDITILPKFWDLSDQGHQQARRSPRICGFDPHRERNIGSESGPKTLQLKTHGSVMTIAMSYQSINIQRRDGQLVLKQSMWYKRSSRLLRFPSSRSARRESTVGSWLLTSTPRSGPLPSQSSLKSTRSLHPTGDIIQKPEGSSG